MKPFGQYPSFQTLYTEVLRDVVNQKETGGFSIGDAKSPLDELSPEQAAMIFMFVTCKLEPSMSQLLTEAEKFLATCQ